jgi:tetratricopeptide (TPR) repeat protein
VDAVVRKCLAFDPDQRYRSAADLQDDLEGHLANKPLKHARERLGRERALKWVARHPRLCSSAGVGIAAGVLLVAVAAAAFVARERSRGLEARTALQDHRAELKSLQAALDDRNRSASRPDEAVDRCRALLGRYGISPEDPDDGWERGRLVRYLSDADREALKSDAGEVFYLMARAAGTRARLTAESAERTTLLRQADRWNTTAAKYAGDRLSRSVLLQQADLARLRGDAAAERAATESIEKTPPGTARDHYLLGAWYARRGRYREALPLLRTATQLEPEHLPAWFVRGTCHLALEQPELAALCFGSCVAVDKEFAPAWLNRGVAYSRLRFFDQACDDYDRALRLDPKLTEARIQRAAAREGLRDLRGAIADLTAALDAGGAPTRIYFIRARLRDAAGDPDGAAADRAAGLKETPADELSWVARAEARLAKDPEAALADVTEALRLNPASMFGLQLQAHILAERLDRPDEAIRSLDRAVELYPEYAPAVAGRGVLLARAGRRAEAVRDAEVALVRDSRPPNLYQVGCIYALVAKHDPAHKAKAMELLWAGLRTGFGLDIVDTDADLDPVRAEPEFRRLVAAARARQAELAR